jgi:hypothetical protein
MTRIDHTGHGHPNTPAGRDWCRKLRLGDRPAFATFDANKTRSGYIITAQDAQGRSLDLNGTAEGEPFQVWSVADAVWVVQNLRHGVDHDWDAETHKIRKVATIELTLMQRTHLTPSGWDVAGMREVHTIHADGTRTYDMR